MVHGSDRSGKPDMRIVSVNVGRPRIVVRAGQPYSSAIDREPAAGVVELTAEGLAGDRCGDTSVHGGPEQALCVYPYEHYAFFVERLRRDLPAPSFGENLTTTGLLKSDVCIGDIFRVGRALVQVSQPRQPCQKLAHKLGDPQIIDWIRQTGYCGFYLRVREMAPISADGEVALEERPHPGCSVAWAARTATFADMPAEELRRLASLPALSARWQANVQKKLAALER
jgi:MOSC domain-containing protein YiiM